MAGSAYKYSALQNERNIRLLRIFPSTDRSTRLEGRLIEYPFSRSKKDVHLYEALSYTWGSPHMAHSIWIENQELPITVNLYTALLHLRDEFIDRMMWIDAICIDQSNIEERGQQVQHMVEIYCKASQVVVWLGEATLESVTAIQWIREAAEDGERSSAQSRPVPESVHALLQRPWFRRVWVLQEAAAARHIIIVCGASQIDGYAFCLGLPPLNNLSGSLFGPMQAINSLIKSSIFRPKYSRTPSGKIMLCMRPLGELMDMYHAYEATDPLDKVFALLGMSTDGPMEPRLLPDYNIPWHDLFGRLITFLLGDKVSHQTFVGRQMAAICGQGFVLGLVTSVTAGRTGNGDVQVNITWTESVRTLEPMAVWSLQPSTRSVQYGDILCWLDGAPKPMIVRPLADHCSIIMVSVTASGGQNQAHSQADLRQTSITRDFPLIWDFESAENNLGGPPLETWLDEMLLQPFEADSQKVSSNAHLGRRVAQILADSGQYSAAAEKFQNSTQSFQKCLGNENFLTIDCMAELAVARGHLKQWSLAKDLWEHVIRTSYTIGVELPKTLRFLSDFMPVLEEACFDYEERKWEAVRHILRAKQETLAITTEIVHDIAEFLDPEVMNILLDQESNDAHFDERTLIAAAQNEIHGVSVVEVLLRRSKSITTISESVLVAAASNQLCGDEVMKLLLEHRTGHQKITHEILRTAAGNGKCTKILMRLLLAQQWDEVQMERISERSWARLASYLLASHSIGVETNFDHTMTLVKAFSKVDNNTLLQLIISATATNIIRQNVRELFQYFCDEFRWHHLEFLFSSIRLCMEDAVAILTHLVLQHDTAKSSMVLEAHTRRHFLTTNPDAVTEEIVNGCSRMMETQTPFQLSLFLDTLGQLGISFGTYVWPDVPPTQSAIMPAIATGNLSFLKILVEKRIVSARMHAFTTSIHRMYMHSEMHCEDLGNFVYEEPHPGMPDWPLFSAITFVYDLQFLRYLRRAGSRMDRNCPDTVTTHEEPGIMTRLRETKTLEDAREDFLNLRGLFLKLAFADVSGAWCGDVRYDTIETLKFSWHLSYPGMWRSMAMIFLRDPYPLAISLYEFYDDSHSLGIDRGLLETKTTSVWPKALSGPEAWQKWRNEAVQVLEEEMCRKDLH